MTNAGPISSAPITIAVDAMGGDHGPSVTVPASISVLRDEPSLRIVLVGIPEQIEPYLRSHAAALGDRLTVRAATQVVGMDEKRCARRKTLRCALPSIL
jgi:glycerol-3-phosphate acyltransferase PlsX